MRQRIAVLVSTLGLIGSMLIVTGTAIAANPAANLDQCANWNAPGGGATNCSSADGSGVNNWVNGNLGASKARYMEGDSVAYRLRFANLATAATVIHTVTIEWDTTKGGKHALDYLTTWDRTVVGSDPTLGVTGLSGAPTDTRAIPPDGQVTGEGVTPVAGDFALWGGTITGVSVYSYPDGTGFSGDKSARLTVSFTATVANPVLAWGGHIATRMDWGELNSAVTIPGSPYHMRLIDLDGAGGNQDRSLSSEAVIFPATINIVKDVVGGYAAQDFAFTETATTLLTPSTFSLDDDLNAALSNTQSYTGITNFISYTFDESVPTHWSLGFNTPPCTVTSPNGGSQTLHGTTGVTISLKEGEVVTCTFKNTHTVSSPTVSTVVMNTNGTDPDTAIANNGHVSIGTVAYDTSTLTGATADVSGTVTYYVEKGDSACSISGATSLGAKTIDGTTHLIPASDTYTFATAGTYYFWAVYGGDDNNNSATSDCTTEIVVTDKNTPTVNTVPSLVPNDAITIGNLADPGSNGYGTLTVELWDGTGCGSGTKLYEVSFVPGDADHPFTGNGTYYTDNTSAITTDAELHWCTSYTGDDNNTAFGPSDKDEIISIDFNPVVAVLGGFGLGLPLLLLGIRLGKKRQTSAG